MGRAFQAVCGSCHQTFPASEGGGFSFESLRCDRCGNDIAVEHQDIWNTYLAMLKGLQPVMPEPDGADDLDIFGMQPLWRTYPGEPITVDEYRHRVEAQAGTCPCGGRFTFDAPLRCPVCHSESVADDGTNTIMFD